MVLSLICARSPKRWEATRAPAQGTSLGEKMETPTKGRSLVGHVVHYPVG
jgi:hypothetical protein